MDRNTAFVTTFISLLIFILVLFSVACYAQYKIKKLSSPTKIITEAETRIPKGMWESSSYTEATKMQGDDST